jgi:propionyl-CoA carboxylase alpha chain
MFKRILIANRGEIACRIIRTARRLGIETVAVYSDADKRALHVAMADQAVPIGPAPASESYLSIEKIVAACKCTGADAVHPGYGFLSEREAFHTALTKAGIVFIGPNANAIRIMGDKIAAKTLAMKAKVTTIPGTLEVLSGEEHARQIAAEIGYPVMIKAAAGGGGKGMRIARTKEEVTEGFARARSEAQSSFGDPRVFIEKFIEDPRHIEIQVLGDKHGNVIYLGERECSIQRRNQKIVEEAPSPLLDADTRGKMGAQAIALAQAVGYDSAGTVEFVAGQDRQFYFLEMNTRLQVEHPVTELVTGIDLVEQMIRVAAGEPLTLKQSDVKLQGWALETRVYAEDPYRNFLPSIGRLTRYRPPAEGSENGITVRNDTGVAEGDEISLYYDPMIAKLVTHAPTRKQAIAAQAHALDAFTIDGIRHNIPFLAALMQHERFQRGELSTGFIAEKYPDGFRQVAPSAEIARTIAAVAAAADHVLTARKRAISGQRSANSSKSERSRVVRLGHTEITLDVKPVSSPSSRARRTKKSEPPQAQSSGALTMSFVGAGNGGPHVLRSRWMPGDPLWAGTFDGKAISVQLRPTLNGFDVSHRGVEIAACVYTQSQAEAARRMPAKQLADNTKAVRCPMPGLVLSVAVVEGQAVKAGEPLAVVEAMKMENVLRAERDGTVKKINAKAGDSLTVDAVIIEFV